MAASTFKAEAMVRKLQQQLALQVSAVVLSVAQDTDEFPILSVSLGGELIYVKVMARDTIRVDALGLPQRASSPHNVILFRDSTITSLSLREFVTAECVRLGTEVLIYDYHTVSSWANFSSATLRVSMYNDPINKLTNAQ
jgi:hypothetical protein